MRPVVLIESPYSGFGVEGIRYLACCLLDSILRGECPIASHAIGPLVLPEREHIRDENGRQRMNKQNAKKVDARNIDLFASCDEDAAHSKMELPNAT